MKTTFGELINGRGPVLADGAMGTMLFELGLDQGEAPERWNLERPEMVKRVHQEYVDAGAQVILTNSFGANRRRLQLHNLADRVGELNRTAARLARSIADGAEQPVLVAGSIGPTGSFLVPLGDMEYGEAVEIFHEQSRALLEGGVDVFWIETMYDLGETRAAVEGCRRSDSELPIVTTLTFDTAGRTMMGTGPAEAARELSELGVTGLGGNCGNGTKEVEAAVDAMYKEDPQLVLTAKANAGIPRLEAGVPVYDAKPHDMARYARRARDRGACIIGACCGSTPEHVRAMAEALKESEKQA